MFGHVVLLEAFPWARGGWTANEDNQYFHANVKGLKRAPPPRRDSTAVTHWDYGGIKLDFTFNHV